MKSVTFSSISGASKIRKLPMDATFADVAHILAKKYEENYKFKFLIDGVPMEDDDQIPEDACVTVMRRILTPEESYKAEDAASQLNSRKWYAIHGMPAQFRRIDKENNLVFQFDLGYNAQRAREIEGTLGESGDDCHDYKENPIHPSEVPEIISKLSEVCQRCRWGPGRHGRRFRLVPKGCIHGMCGRCCSNAYNVCDIYDRSQALACPRHHAHVRQQQIKFRQQRKH